MISGIIVAADAIYSLADHQRVVHPAGHRLFSLGELMSSPTKMRYFNNIAPPGKKGLYLGTSPPAASAGPWVRHRWLHVRRKRRQGRAGAPLSHAGARTGAEAVGAMEDGCTSKLMELTSRMPPGCASCSTPPTTLVLCGPAALIGLVSMIGLIIYDRITQAKVAWKAMAWS